MSDEEAPVCTSCGSQQGGIWRLREDREALICEACLDLLNDILDEGTDDDRARWLAETVSETCSFCGDRGARLCGMKIACRPPAFICEGCVARANIIRTSN